MRATLRAVKIIPLTKIMLTKPVNNTQLTFDLCTGFVELLGSFLEFYGKIFLSFELIYCSKEG